MWQTIAALALFAFSAAVLDRMISFLFDYVDRGRKREREVSEAPSRFCRIAVENPVYARQAQELAEKLYPGCKYQFYTGSFDDVVNAFNAHKAEIAVILDREDIPLNRECEEEKLSAYGTMMEFDGIEMAPLDPHARKLVVFSADNHDRQ